MMMNVIIKYLLEKIFNIYWYIDLYINNKFIIGGIDV